MNVKSRWRKYCVCGRLCAVHNAIASSCALHLFSSVNRASVRRISSRSHAPMCARMGCEYLIRVLSNSLARASLERTLSIARYIRTVDWAWSMSS